MPVDDWLIGGDRRAAAAERIYDAATDLIAHDGLNTLDIDKLAIRVHCSRATIYRYVGGKTEIRNAVVKRTAERIVDSVRSAVEPLTGSERLVASILLTLQQIRADPLCQLMVSSIRGGTREVAWFAESPLLADFATELAGLAGGDPQAPKWVIRVVLSLMYWPAENEEAERRLVQTFVAPAFAGQ
ncbi:MAG: TetR/AcrR family transcriptional regulator [Mycobacterium pseudokansasii]|uniref:Putative HTH-type transcriptional regulator n=1 Tax=Mycobacterium pseudokansasii TaxID=2341080 RepID=A0A498QS60_9MYCO|nr:TetR/AcrR family transcriptional regulator [Mycobacterium pseudokansasii]KZS64108.1 transcriptional regulator [Mycobacterium kansasii]MBY0391503.1 TetR/AcrR family transcriptional regulator [Mycobacterium pseudokansasii]VAZ95408.1 putative HTH-type transcriptional regulator [Mycobacterium pseudokansasii]VAZ96670.1 putative HTH-type transcriptional regulator [Mycobacterium pseudokansasii]VBA50941.1 putative HTH-type transcriptional regulator [Mycobacterium pseudokansasii]